MTRFRRRASNCAIRPLAVLVTALLLGACNRTVGKDEPRGIPAAQAVYIHGWNTTPAPAWRSAPLYSIREIDSVGFSSPMIQARFEPGGSLLVANGGELVRISPDGTEQQRIGRHGDGPGEFQLIGRLGVNEDGEVFATDFNTGRITVIAVGGTTSRTIAGLQPAIGGGGTEVVTLLANDMVLTVPWLWRPVRSAALAGIPSGRLVRDAIALVAFDSSGAAPRDTLGVWPGLERYNHLIVPYARGVVYESWGAYTVIGTTDSLDLTLFRNHTPIGRLVGSGARRQVSDGLLTAWDSAAADEIGADQARAIRTAEANLDRDGSLPEVGAIALDDLQRIWVGEFVSPGDSVQQWTVFGQHGVSIGRLPLPSLAPRLIGFRAGILDVRGDRIALLRENDDGTLFIEVRRIEQ